MEKAKLIACANELNKVLDLDPAIVIRGRKVTAATLEKDIKGIKAMLDPADKFTDESTAVLIELELVAAPVPEPDSAAGKTTTEPKPGKTPASDSKTSAPKAAPKPKRKMTRGVASVMALKNGATKANLAEKTNDEYIKAGGSDNLKESKYWAVNTPAILEAWGAEIPEG